MSDKSIFQQVMESPLPGDVLRFPGGQLWYVVVRSASTVAITCDRHELLRTAKLDGETLYGSRTCGVHVDPQLWPDFVRFACTVERAS